MPKLARAEGWKRGDEKPTMRFERLRGGRVLEAALRDASRDDADDGDEPEVPTVRIPERGARATVRSPMAQHRRTPPPVPRMRTLVAPPPAPSPPRTSVHPDERESGIRTRPPVSELATISAVGMPRMRQTQQRRAPLRPAPISETLVCSTPHAGVPSLILNGPARSVVFEEPRAVEPSLPSIVIAPAPPEPTARRRPTLLARRPATLRVPIFLLLVAIAFVSFAGVRLAPALHRASAALALR